MRAYRLEIKPRPKHAIPDEQRYSDSEEMKNNIHENEINAKLNALLYLIMYF